MMTVMMRIQTTPNLPQEGHNTTSQQTSTAHWPTSWLWVQYKACTLRHFTQNKILAIYGNITKKYLPSNCLVVVSIKCSSVIFITSLLCYQFNQCSHPYQEIDAITTQPGSDEPTADPSALAPTPPRPEPKAQQHGSDEGAEQASTRAEFQYDTHCSLAGGTAQPMSHTHRYTDFVILFQRFYKIQRLVFLFP